MKNYDMAICKVECKFKEIGRRFTNKGSGFFISDNGLFVTNNHIVSNDFSGPEGLGVEYSEDITVTTPLGKCPASLVIDKESDNPIDHDYAILKLNIEPSAYFDISDDLKISQKDRVIAIGYPSGFDKTVITAGIISAIFPTHSRKNKLVETYRYVTDTVITHGNSGGPLIRESDGKVIGISNMGYTIKDSKRETLKSYLKDTKVDEKIKFLIRFMLDYIQTGLNYAVPIEYVIRDPIFESILN